MATPFRRPVDEDWRCGKAAEGLKEMIGGAGTTFSQFLNSSKHGQ